MLEEKPVVVGNSALKHGLETDYIIEMWYDGNCEGFEIRRTPPRETNIIAIRFLACPDGILEMIAEDEVEFYYVFHAQMVPGGKITSLIAEAFELSGMFTS